jgi:mRNA interferase RelE/StbE
VKVEFHPDVYKQLQRLPRQIFAVALEAIIGLATDPRPTGVVKLVGSSNDWRIRIGQYRIVYEIDEREGVVTVLTVAKRSDVYR